MRTALLLASLLVLGAALAAAPTATAGPVTEACDTASGGRVHCERLFTECRSDDVLLDAVCRDVINPVLRSL